MDVVGGGGSGGWCCPPVDLMRSEPMQLVQLIIPIESAHLTVAYLGDLGLLQFKDVRTSNRITPHPGGFFPSSRIAQKRKWF